MTSTINTTDSRAETGSPRKTMQAVTWDRYGAPADVLRVSNVPVPHFGPDDIRVRVRAAGANPYDWHFYRGDPYLVRMSTGFRKPKQQTQLGADFAGEVESVGANITGFKPGDRVFGEVALGAFAEYVVAPAQNVAHMPAILSFEQAAAVPMGAFTALASLRKAHGGVKGRSVLINGASGGIGIFAVQLAKAMGASRVVGVCSGRNADLVTRLGADEIIDYAKSDYTESPLRFDLLVDTQATQPFRRSIRAVKPRGTYAFAGGGGGKLLGPGAPMLRAVIAGLIRRQRVVTVMAGTSGEDLVYVAGLIAAGKVRAKVEQAYPLECIVEAMWHLETGHVRGKVVVTI